MSGFSKLWGCRNKNVGVQEEEALEFLSLGLPSVCDKIKLKEA